MKLVIPQEKLKEGLTTAERATSRSLTLPVLNNILIKTEKNFLKISATDLEIGINWWALAKTEKEGAIVLPGQILSSFIHLLPKKPVALESKDLSINIECENYKSTFKGFNPEDFPIIPSIEEGEALMISSPLLCQGLNQVVGIAAFSTTKPEISGVYFVFQKDQIKLVATDSFRLGEKTIFFGKPRDLARDYTLILPQKAVREVINIFGEREEEIEIRLSGNQILFESQMEETKHPKLQLVSRLIEGEFPNYQEIIPQKTETQIILRGREFLNQIKTASIFSGKISEVKLKINEAKGEIEISSQNPDLGEYQSQLPAKIKGKNLEISFNHKFLIDGLLNIALAQEGESEIILGLTSEEGPAILKGANDPSYIYILMPIKKS